MFIIFIPITQQPEQDRWAENQPTAGLSSLNEYEYENGMRRSRTELHVENFFQTALPLYKVTLKINGIG